MALYRDIKQQLIADIASGQLPPGGMLPNESELARRFAVSIGTLRRAVDELVADHILVRQQGRGTFVGQLDRERFMFQFFKITARDGTREFPQVRLVSFDKGRASEEQALQLGLQRSAPVYLIENVLSLQGRPAIYDHITLSVARFPGLSRPQFEGRSGTIYGLYQNEFGVTVVGADERLRAEGASARCAELLGLPEGAPVLRIERIARTVDGQPAELRVSVVDTRGHDYFSNVRGDT